MNFYELSTEHSVGVDSIVSLLAEFLKIEPSKIGQSATYWERLTTETPLDVGLSLEHSARGFQTLVTWVWEGNLSPEDQLGFASYVSEQLHTATAIADFIEQYEIPGHKFLMVSPSGVVQPCIAIENSDAFVLTPAGQEMSLSEAIELLRARL